MKKSLYALVVVMMAVGTAMSFSVRAEEPLPPPIQALERQGVKILGPIKAPGDMKGYAAVIEGRGLAAYVLPGGKHAIIGTLINERAEDLTRAPLEEYLSEPLPDGTWEQLENSTWLQDGRADAERVVYVFTDPNCPFCNMFWHNARPWVVDGRVQLRHIIVGVLGEDSVGKAAALLAAENPAEALKRHYEQGKKSDLEPLSPIPEDIEQKIYQNVSLMADLGSMSTPTILYKDDEGNVQVKLGVPRGDELDEVMGGAL